MISVGEKVRFVHQGRELEGTVDRVAMKSESDAMLLLNVNGRYYIRLASEVERVS